MNQVYRHKENGINYHVYEEYNHESNQHKVLEKYKWVKIYLTFDVDAIAEPYILTYYKNGKIHNEFGPAIITRDGIFNETFSYYIDGKVINELYFKKLLRKKKLRNLEINT